ncbi:hypothetical protein [Thiocapsa marina]|uniref:Uncharacterized protein n=1 Tax=Thiocapsa marina 5811 TaxID=768671 RepID=F9UHW1_9GAMM|nr:hypothetical protein [Thiocapsa marina]EGV16137.1 hypothetical protein ThimaDRAFT_4514 [Thiocapsa marina 5811]
MRNVWLACSVSAAVLFISTLLLFPWREPGAVIRLSTGEFLATPDIVTLSPLILGRPLPRGEPAFVLHLKPDMDDYASQLPLGESVALVATSVARNGYGVESRNASVAWGEWIMSHAALSMVVGLVVYGLLQRR